MATTALVLWGGNDHKDRAEALATTYGTTAENVTRKPKKVKGLKTLVFWGHGDPKNFCHLTSDEFVALVAAWKKENAELDTVEILTCNARHKNGAFSDSFTEQVVKKLNVQHAGIRFRALPVATAKNGSTCAWSILKWQPQSATWAYVAAADFTAGSTSQYDSLMHAGVKLIEDFMPPRGTENGYARAYAALLKFKGMTTTNAYAVKRKWDQKKVDEYNRNMADVLDNTYIIAGNIGMLRWCLVDIN